MKAFLKLTLTAFALLGTLTFAGCTAEKKPLTSDTLLVKKAESVPEGFLFGCDVSSLLSEEASGVKYYDFEGKEADLLKILSDAGINYVRVRIWVDPFDKDGHGYGGGNCSLDTAIRIGERAKRYGMKLLADFHYSDFWADPSKQQVPKAWKTMSMEQKKEAIRTYTRESVEALKKANLTLGMVAIGNETTTGFAGSTRISDVTALMAAASEEVRKASPDTLISVHYTNPESVNFSNLAFQLAVANVDYDVFSTSYYAYWHGSLENLKEKLSEVAKTYGKKVMVAETQWAYTTADSDFSGNTIGEALNYDKPYAFSVQGQANLIRDLSETVASIEGNAGIGVFYWEPAWIKVPADTYEDALKLWEQYGSGWASSYAAEYDPDDAGKYYGGSACDNQALFGPDGHPLESLKVFSLIRSGNDVKNDVDTAENALIEVKLNNPVVLPETVDCLMFDNTVTKLPVTWDVTEERLNEISASPVGMYDIPGTCSGLDVTLTVKMVEENYVENYSFEKDDRSMWVIDAFGGGEQTDYQNKALDAYSGDYSLHFWNADKVGFDVSQTVTGLREGSYSFSVEAQGGDFKEGATLYIYAISDDEEYRESFELTGWKEFKNPVIRGIRCANGTIKVGVRIEAAGGAWGTLDDFLLNPEK